MGSHLIAMHPPIFVRELRGAERAQLEVGRRSRSAFTMRRAQIVLLSAAGQPPRAIAAGLGCARQTVRNAIRAFNADDLAALTEGSSRPKSAARVLDGSKLEQLHCRPRSPSRSSGPGRPRRDRGSGRAHSSAAAR